MNDYLKVNEIFWNREYRSPNPEGFIFRLKSKLLDYYINICKGEKDLKRKFKIYKPIRLSFYDWSYGINKLISGHHFTFFGKKIR